MKKVKNILLAGLIIFAPLCAVNAQNVGIGNISFTPANQLHIYNSAGTGTFQISSNTSGILSANGSLIRVITATDDFEFLQQDATGKMLFNTSGGNIVFNENSSNIDFRVESNNNANMLFVDGGTDNVGIGTATPNASALLEVSSTTKGVLLPKVALSATNNNAPIGAGVATGLIVYNTATAGAFPNDVTPGYYWWSGQWERFSSNPKPAWYTTGNTGTNPAQYFLGTTDNQPVAIRSNNVERMRITPVGEVIIGGTAPVMAGDLFMSSSLAGYEWPINAYASHDGGAFYGDIRPGNTTDMCAMELEHYGTGAGYALMGVNNSTNASTFAGTGIYGESSAGHNGSDYWSNNYAGVYGWGAFGTDQYSFGVVGVVDWGGLRSGGVMGTYWTNDWGALGYVNSVGSTFGLCYVGGVTTTAKGTNHVATSMGMGGYGDLMGGWIRGNIYGLNVSGERYSLYLHGKQFTNDIITILSDVSGNAERIPTYVPASMTVDVYAKGTATIVNGEANISFNTAFRDVISDTDPVIVTVTPIGRSANLYIDNSSKGGFKIIDDSSEEEIKSQPLTFTWIAIGTRKGYENPQNPPELLSKSYETNMDGVMFNESDLQNSALPIWWDGQQLRFDTPPKSAKQVFLEGNPINKAIEGKKIKSPMQRQKKEDAINKTNRLEQKKN